LIFWLKEQEKASPRAISCAIRADVPVPQGDIIDCLPKEKPCSMTISNESTMNTIAFTLS